MVKADPWGEPRVEGGVVEEGEPGADDAMSIRQRIRLMGKAAMSQKAKVAPAGAGPARKPLKGLKKHIHSEQYDGLRNINRQTCFNGLLSLVLAIVSVPAPHLPANPL